MENRRRMRMMVGSVTVGVTAGLLACGAADRAGERETRPAGDLAIAGAASPQVGRSGPNAGSPSAASPAGFVEWATTCPYPYRFFHPPGWQRLPVVDPESMRRSLDARGGRRLALDFEGWLGAARVEERRVALAEGPDLGRLGTIEIMGEDVEIFSSKEGVLPSSAPEVGERRVYTLFAPLERLGGATVFYGRLRAISTRPDPGARFVGDDTVLQVLGSLELNVCE